MGFYLALPTMTAITSQVKGPMGGFYQLPNASPLIMNSRTEGITKHGSPDYWAQYNLNSSQMS